LILRFCDNAYSDSFVSTIGVDFKMKNIQINNQNVKVQLWDTAGQERYRTITTGYYRGAHAILLVFDLTNRKSFTNIDMWLNECKELANSDTVLVLIGNKKDMARDRIVTTLEVEEYVKGKNVLYFEVSCKSGVGVDEVFSASITRILEKQQK